MPVTVKIPAPLRPLTQNQSEVVIEATGTVGAAVAELTTRFPGLKDRLLDDKGALRRYVNVFRNEEDIRAAGGLGASLKDGDKLAVVPAIAGGRR
jgi:molybdopterin synthase sulfur carrier subunit